MKRLLLAALVCVGLAAPASADIYRISNSIVTIPNLTVGTLTATLGKFADGTVSAPSGTFTNDLDTGFYLPSVNNFSIVAGGALGLSVSTSGVYVWSGEVFLGSSYDAQIHRVAADTAGLYRSTNPQTWLVYGTRTDASNYERGYLDVGTTGLIVGHEAAGTGTVRAVRLTSTFGAIITDGGSKPSCDADHRGVMWRDEGGAGAADTFEVCAKNSSDTYDWYALATIP